MMMMMRKRTSASSPTMQWQERNERASFHRSLDWWIDHWWEKNTKCTLSLIDSFAHSVTERERKQVPRCVFLSSRIHSAISVLRTWQSKQNFPSVTPLHHGSVLWAWRSVLRQSIQWHTDSLHRGSSSAWLHFNSRFYYPCPSGFESVWSTCDLVIPFLVMTSFLCSLSMWIEK